MMRELQYSLVQVARHGGEVLAGEAALAEAGLAAQGHEDLQDDREVHLMRAGQ